MTKQHEKSTYNSNPFTLSFNALGSLFNVNLAWPLVLIGLEFFSWIMQGFSMIIDAATKSGSTTAPYEPALTTNPNPMDVGVIIAIATLVVGFVVIASIIASVIGTYFMGMYSYVALHSLNNKKVGFGEAFSAVTKRFWRLFFAQLLANLKIVGGLFLFIIPGIRAYLRYSILPYVIMSDPEGKSGITSTHDRAKELTRGRLMEPFGVQTVASLIPLAGTSLSFAGTAALYSQLAHYHDHKLEKPKVHWLNYIAFSVLVFILLMGAFIGMMIVALNAIA